MAEIKIEKKAPIWPWILVILAILVAAYFIFLKDDVVLNDGAKDNEIEQVRDNESLPANNNTTAEDTMLMDTNSKVLMYNTYLVENADMDINHEFSSKALNKLIDATEEVAMEAGVDVKADLETARSNANSIKDNPKQVDHANKIKKAGTTITEALKKIQMQNFPDLEKAAADLKNAVEKIDPAKQTLEQKATIKNFFNQAGELLTNMNNN